MQIEEGKYYKDRTGRVWGPMVRTDDDSEYDFAAGEGTWMDFGAWWPTGSVSTYDLIEEVAGPLPEGGSSVSVKAPTCALGLLLDIQQAAHERGYEIEAFTYGEGSITLDMKEKEHA